MNASLLFALIWSPLKTAACRIWKMTLMRAARLNQSGKNQEAENCYKFFEAESWLTIFCGFISQSQTLFTLTPAEHEPVSIVIVSMLIC